MDLAYNKIFIREVEKVLEHEGGYVCDPDDAGGETKFGISKRAFPDTNILAREQGKYTHWAEAGAPKTEFSKPKDMYSTVPST